MKFLFFDTESTGVSPEDHLIQFASMDAIAKQSVGIHLDEIFFERKVRPPVKIKFDAMGVHHITEEDVARCPSFQDSDVRTLVENRFSMDFVAVAHNVEFDLEMLKKEGVEMPKRKICTLKVARHLLPHAPSHKLQTLRYYLGLDKKMEKRSCYHKVQAHDALGDVIVLRELFLHFADLIFADEDFQKSQMRYPNDYEAVGEAMIKMTKEPVLLSTVPWGKYKGCRFDSVALDDPSYLAWMLKEVSKKTGTPDGDEDLEYSLQQYLSSPHEKPATKQEGFHF